MTSHGQQELPTDVNDKKSPQDRAQNTVLRRDHGIHRGL
jgi:hypothetical protein